MSAAHYAHRLWKTPDIFDIDAIFMMEPTITHRYVDMFLFFFLQTEGAESAVLVLSHTVPRAIVFLISHLICPLHIQMSFFYPNKHFTSFCTQLLDVVPKII